MTITATKTDYQSLQEALDSYKAKTDEERRKIQTYVRGWRVDKDDHCFSPRCLWHDLKELGLKIHIYACIVLADEGTGNLRDVIMSEGPDDHGATDLELDQVFLNLNDTILC